MPLDHTREVILAEARAEAERILKTAQARRQEKLENAREALEDEFARRCERARHEAQQHAQRRIIARRAKHNLELLARRNEILDDLFAQAAQKLATLPDGEYRTVVQGWMRAIPDDVGGTVLCNERDEERLAPLVAELNEGRSEEAKLQLARHPAPLRGGVLFQTATYEIDLSLDARVARLREVLAPEVARAVFPDEVTV